MGARFKRHQCSGIAEEEVGPSQTLLVVAVVSRLCLMGVYVKWENTRIFIIVCFHLYCR